MSPDAAAASPPMPRAQEPLVWARRGEDFLGNVVPGIVNGVLIAGHPGLQGLTGIDSSTGATRWVNPDLPACQSSALCGLFASTTVAYVSGGTTWTPIDALTGVPTGGPSITVGGDGLPALANGAIYYLDALTGALTSLAVPGIG